MKIISNCFTFLLVAVSMLLSVTFSCVAFAKEISLYEQPKADAKVVGAVDLATGIIPIYTPKEGEWVKVADPKNGNVGWIKSSELSATDSLQTTVTVRQSPQNTNKESSAYQIMQYSQPKKLTMDEAQAITKQMQAQTMFESVHRSMHQMINDMNRMFDNDWYFMHNRHVPVIMPLVIVPVEKSTDTKAEQTKIEQTSAKSPATSVESSANSTTTTKKK